MIRPTNVNPALGKRAVAKLTKPHPTTPNVPKVAVPKRPRKAALSIPTTKY